MTPPSRLALSWPRLILFGLLFAALSVGVPYAIHRQLGGEWPVLDGRLLQPAFLVALLGLLVVYFLADGLRLWFVLRSMGYRIPGRQMAPLVFLNILISNITPLASGGGFAQIWYLRRLGVHVGAATAAATLRTLLASIGIFVPALLMLWFWPELAGRTLHEGWAFTLGLLALGYLSFFALVLWRLRWLLAGVRSLLDQLARWHWLSEARALRGYRAARREMVRFAVALRVFAGRRGPDAWLAVLATVTFLLALFSFPALLLWGLGHPPDYLATLALSTITTFVMYFAPTPGASGVAEGLFGVLFATRVTAADLVLLVVAWRFLTIHLPMLLGIPVLLHALARRTLHDT